MNVISLVINGITLLFVVACLLFVLKWAWGELKGQNNSQSAPLAPSFPPTTGV